LRGIKLVQKKKRKEAREKNSGPRITQARELWQDGSNLITAKGEKTS